MSAETADFRGAGVVATIIAGAVRSELVFEKGGGHTALFRCRPCLDIVCDVNYSSRVIEVLQSTHFRDWLKRLSDRMAAERIFHRVGRLERGLFGDVKFFEGIGELRIDHGPGYRVYFVKRGRSIVILLCAGDKRTQPKDIERARTMAAEIRHDD